LQHVTVLSERAGALIKLIVAAAGRSRLGLATERLASLQFRVDPWKWSNYGREREIPASLSVKLRRFTGRP